MTITKKTYKTKDQFIASTIYSLGGKINSIPREDKECFFVFDNKEQCEMWVIKYYAGELKIDPRLLFDAFKTIKSIIYNK
jgi:hypothetical protein